MSKLMDFLYNMRLLDDISGRETAIHRIHPLSKLLTTVFYLTVVVSFGKYEISSLLPFLFYPVLILSLGEVPLVPVLKRIIIVSPLIICIGIFNPVFDNQVFVFQGIQLSMGWISFLSILIRSTFTVAAALLLIATTGMDQLASAMRMLRIPRLFVLQLLLTWRYIAVLMEEVNRTLRAYSLRAPEQKGVRRHVWGTLAGQILLRTFDRAERVYQAMSIRGFTGEYNTGKTFRIRLQDFVFFAGWGTFFVLARMYNIPQLTGLFLTGAF